MSATLGRLAGTESWGIAAASLKGQSDAVPPRHPAGHRREPCDARLQALAAGAASRGFVTPLAGRRDRLDRVTVVEEGDITAEDMRRTGMSRDELRASIAGDGTLVRMELRLAGDDPRIALREREPDHAELEAIVARLARIDAACPTRWTTRYLQLVADQPGIVSRALAPQADADVPAFKRRVRQLKELGLTESLEVGYRLSPRGRAVFERLVGDPR